MKAHLKYARYILRHKWFVFLAACRLGIPWLGVIHDLSKFLPSEWFPYVHYFYADKAPRRRDRTGYYKPNNTGDAAFDAAWLYHARRNKHHWQWWVLVYDEGDIKPQPMPERYWREMIADWRGAGRAQGTPDTKAWYMAHRDIIKLHPETRERVETVLEVRP